MRISENNFAYLLGVAIYFFQVFFLSHILKFVFVFFVVFTLPLATPGTNYEL